MALGEGTTSGIFAEKKENASRAGDRVRFFAMGTQCEVQYVAPHEKAGKQFIRETLNWVRAFEAKYSRFRAESLIGCINIAAGRDWVAIDADAERMFALADQVMVLTRGIVDPTTLPLVRLWNYQADKPRVPTREEVAAALRKLGWSRVRREPGRIYLPEAGMGLDLGGFGKEHAVDCVAELALQYGIENALIDFGQDVRVIGMAPNGSRWTIGVEDPKLPGALRMRLVVDKGGIATSGHHLRYFEAEGRRYGHIIDPRTGYPVCNDCIAVTIVAGSCFEAGLLATTAFILGGEEGIQMIGEFSGAEGSVSCTDREYQTEGFHRYIV